MNTRGWQQRRTARSDRWKREDSAPRLRDEVPRLQTLKMNLAELNGEHGVPGSRRIQHVIVAQASVRFEIPCGDSACEEGGHDLSRTALDQLRAGRTSFSGTSLCSGRIGDRPCERRLEYQFEASYS
jgi:hypothetical protein